MIAGFYLTAGQQWGSRLILVRRLKAQHTSSCQHTTQTEAALHVEKPSQVFNVLLLTAACCQVLGLLLWYQIADVGPALFRLTHDRSVEITPTWLKSMVEALLAITGGIWLNYVIIRRTKFPQTVQFVVYILALPVALGVAWFATILIGGGTFVARG